MNILLFTQEDILEKSDDHVRINITGNRFKHIQSVQEFSLGDEIRIGEINGLRGKGKIVKVESESLIVEGHINQQAPKPSSAKLIMAMPRPIMLKRILVDVAMLGIKEIVLLQSTHVQKSYWTSKLFANNDIENYLLKGLEQSCDTRLPTVHIRKRFKTFVEDELKDFADAEPLTTNIFLAHPSAERPCPQPAQNPFTLIVGPENGFTPYEVDLFVANGAQAVTVGERHLRVETAVTYLLGRLL